jgi:pre-mRNA-processing factor 19
MTDHSEGGDFTPTLQFFTVDVFTEQRFNGNPLAVVLVPPSLATAVSQNQKQRIAREFNLSETVFLHEPRPDAEAINETAKTCRADIFTIDTELPFAGHPTIGAAHIILRHLGWDVEFLHLKAGLFRISRSESGSDKPTSTGPVKVRVAHDLHVHSQTLADIVNAERQQGSDPAAQSAYRAVSAALSQDEAIRRAELQAPVVSIVRGMTVLLVRLPSLEHLAIVSTASRLVFDEVIQGLLLDNGPWGSSFCYRYYYVHEGEGNGEGKAAESGGKVVTRLRARMIELDFEDPATGSAAVTLGSYLTINRHSDKSVARYEITQGVEMGRKSDIAVEVKPAVVDGVATVGELSLEGNAVIVMSGRIRF